MAGRGEGTEDGRGEPGRPTAAPDAVPAPEPEGAAGRGGAKGSDESRFDLLSRRTQVVVAIAGTLVAIVTGMVALGSKVLPSGSHAAVADASLPQYHQSVGAVCASINEHERDRARDSIALRRRVAKAHGLSAQRDAVQESVQRTLNDGEHDLAMLRGYDAPAALRPTVRATVAAWERLLAPTRAYAHRLDVADTSGRAPEFLTAIRRYADARSRMAQDNTAERAGLHQLGGDSCRLDDEIVTRPVRIVFPARHHHHVGSASPNSSATPTTSAKPNDGGGAVPQLSRPSATVVAPSGHPSPNVVPRSNLPAPTGGVSPDASSHSGGDAMEGGSKPEPSASSQSGAGAG
jgi:hypothetical protein